MGTRFLTHSLATVAGTVAAIALLSCAHDASREPESTATAARGAYMERQAQQLRLTRLTQRLVTEDPAIAERREVLQETLRRAVEAIDPTALEAGQRLVRIRAELEEAWARGDSTRLRELLDERSQLREALHSTQAAAFRRPEVIRELAGFRAEVTERIRSMNPEVYTQLESSSRPRSGER